MADQAQWRQTGHTPTIELLSQLSVLVFIVGNVRAETTIAPDRILDGCDGAPDSWQH